MPNRLQTLISRLRLRLLRPRPVLDEPREERLANRHAEKQSLVALSRYGIIAACCRYYKPGGAILELGCGEGLLREALEPGNYGRYVGVDRSESAIKHASVHEDAKSAFVVEDATYYIPRERFDIIIFGNWLNALPAPAAVLARYLRYLRPRGIFLVSMPKEHGETWSALDGTYRNLDSVQIACSTGFECTCRIYSTQTAPTSRARRSGRNTRTS